jgi:outer membrane protein OmpA-like peptidoglycan-associated protein
MAHLEVEPKPARPWWIWALTIIVLIALAAMLLRKCDVEYSDAKRAAAADSTQADAIAGPDWKAVDFYAGPTTDSDLNDGDIETRTDGNYTIYTIGENILFPSSGNDITESGQAKLKMISEVLKKRFEGATIGVFGSADSTGSAGENNELGKQRAEAVKNWLTSNGNIPGETISVQSFGETKPTATNETEAGRKQNRNVSIVVFPKQ